MFLNGYPYTDFHELNADFLLKNYKLLLDSLRKIDGWIETHEKEYEELKGLVDQIEDGVLPEAVYDKIKLWCIKNTTEIIGAAIKTVFFGLENGYFVAYIPDSWSEILFGTTGLDDFPADYDFGHLTLTY